MQRTNTITKPVAGVDRSFRFGMGFWAALAELRSLGLDQLLPVAAAANHAQSPHFLRARADVLYCAALCHCETEGMPQDFTRADALDWMDEMTGTDQAEVAALAITTTSNIWGGKSLAEVIQAANAPAEPTPTKPKKPAKN